MKRNSEQKPNRRLVAALLAILLIVSCVGAASYAYADALSDAKRELESVQAQLKNLKSQIESGKKEAKVLQSKLTDLDRSITAAEAAVDKLNAEIVVTKGRVAEAQAALNNKESEVADQDELMGLRIRNMYKNGEVSILQILLGSESITDLMTNIDMAARIMDNDVDLLHQLEAQYETLHDYREELKALQASLEAQQKAATEQQQSLESARADVATTKASIEQNTKLLEQQVDAMNAEANALTAEILKLQTDAAYVGGTMLWPVPASTRITSPFGYRIHPILGTNKLHTGIDIGVGSYNEVLAVNAGTVIKAAWNNSYGYMVMIDHGGGIVTLYAHNTKLLVKTGDVVTKGQQVAWSGSTGMSTGPHVHFEVRLNGVYQDPISPEYLGTYVN